MKTLRVGENKMKSYEKSDKKQLCRDMLVKLTEQHIGVPKKVITLPSETAMCVKTFKKHWPEANYIGIERDRDSWVKICKQGINCYNSDIRQFVHSQIIPGQHCDMFFMDYYSYLNANILGDIKGLLSNRNIIHKGKPMLLGLTLMKAMRGDKENTIDFMREYIDNGRRIEMENNLHNVESALATFLSNEFPSAEDTGLEYSLEYETGVPMYFLVFKIIL